MPEPTRSQYEPCVIDSQGRCTRFSHDHAEKVPTELARIQTGDDLLAGLTAEVNRLAEAVGEAESKRDAEYHLACELCSLLADYLDGVPIKLSELSVEARRRVVAYQHQRGIGRLGIPGRDEHGLLPDVPPVQRDSRDDARYVEVIDVDPL